MMDYIKVVEAEDNQGQKHGLKLKIWDADEESVNHFSHLYLKDAQVVLLCYAMNDK